MDRNFIDILSKARSYFDPDTKTTHIPSLGCSRCGVACLPLGGIGVKTSFSKLADNEELVSFARKRVQLKTSKMSKPSIVQLVSVEGPVIAYEKALRSLKYTVDKNSNELCYFDKPIPTVTGLQCAACNTFCQICDTSSPPEKPAQTVYSSGRFIRVCADCSVVCKSCDELVIKYTHDVAKCSKSLHKVKRARASV